MKVRAMFRHRTRVIVTAAIATALGAVLAFAAPANAASFNELPTRDIGGPATLLDQSNAMAIAPDGTIWVASDNAAYTVGSILAFAPGAAGNSAPEFDITGPLTGLIEPYGIALDGSGNAWVADASANALLEFAAGANGNQAPIRTISGAATQLNFPSGIDIGPTGTIYVADSSDRILEFASGVSGDVAPVTVITGSNTQLATFAVQHVALRADGSMVVAGKSGAVETFPATATGNVAPSRLITGSATELDGPFTVALDGEGNIYVDDCYGSGDTISEFSPNANGNVAPVNTITGAFSELSSLTAVASDSGGDVFGAIDDTTTDSGWSSILEYSPMLTVDSVDSTTGSPSGGQSVTVHGVGFLGDATVTFGGLPATDVTVVSSTEITVITPAHAIGSVPVVVSQNGAAETQTLADGFTYVAGLAVTGIDPTVGIAVAFALVAAGGALLLLRRRKLSER